MDARLGGGLTDASAMGSEASIEVIPFGSFNKGREVFVEALIQVDRRGWRGGCCDFRLDDGGALWWGRAFLLVRAGQAAKLLAVDFLSGIEQSEALGEVLKLADVARPGVVEDLVEKGLTQLHRGASSGLELLQEVFEEVEDVFGALPQGGNDEADDVEAKEQVFAEAAVFNGVFKGLIRGGDDAGVGLNDLLGADGADLSFLNGAEQGHLGGHGDIADFIEEQGALIGGLEEPGFVPSGAGEAAFDVAKELGFEEVLGDGSAVEGDEAPFTF